LQGFIRRDLFDLNEVRPPVGETRFQEQMFGLTVVREEEQPFAVRIEPPYGIDIGRKRAEIIERPAARTAGELG